MTEPTCRSCYRASLSPMQQERFDAEPVTGCIYYCPEHQAEHDAMLTRLAPFLEGVFIPSALPALPVERAAGTEK